MTIVYAPQDAETTQIMNYFQTQNQARTGSALAVETNVWDSTTVPKNDMGIVPMASDKFIYDYALANPDTIQLGKQLVSAIDSHSSLSSNPNVVIFFHSKVLCSQRRLPLEALSTGTTRSTTT